MADKNKIFHVFLDTHGGNTNLLSQFGHHREWQPTVAGDPCALQRGTHPHLPADHQPNQAGVHGESRHQSHQQGPTGGVRTTPHLRQPKISNQLHSNSGKKFQNVTKTKKSFSFFQQLEGVGLTDDLRFLKELLCQNCLY